MSHYWSMDARNRIRRHIEETDGLSYANVAARAGLSSSAVHKYCTGQVQSMTLENIEKIARAMNVSLRWVIFGEGDPNIEHIFDRIPLSKRDQALKILHTFIEDDGTNG